MSRIQVNRQLQQTACLFGIGLCVGGAFLGIPDTYKTWKFVREPAGDLFGQRHTQTSIYRVEEEVPTRRKPYKTIQGQSQRKLTGMVLLFFGGNLAWYFGQILALEFEIIEKRCYIIRQSDSFV